ncbi:DUF2523 family protein [Ideonella sp.]|uniref:DUF2523 family protein n=1 Tax=Ideonella sp. TaxID=1929293 RepID=UPI0035AF15D7
MPVFIGALIGALIDIAGTLVGKVLVSLGIGYAVFSGVDASIAWARDYTLASISGMGSVAVGIAATMKIGVFVSMVSSAFVVRLTLLGLQGGTIRRMVQK